MIGELAMAVLGRWGSRQNVIDFILASDTRLCDVTYMQIKKVHNGCKSPCTSCTAGLKPVHKQHLSVFGC